MQEFFSSAWAFWGFAGTAVAALPSLVKHLGAWHNRRLEIYLAHQRETAKIDAAIEQKRLAEIRKRAASEDKPKVAGPRAGG